MGSVARGCDVNKRALKEENERLEAELSEAIRKNGNLLSANIKYEDRVKQLNADLLAEKEKYAALLEKYIAMMEKTTRINEPAPDEKVVLLLDEVGGLILKWQVDNAYDQQLDSGFAKIKEKYMGGRRK